MMGGWFLATSIGNKLSGVLSSMWDGYVDKSNFFWVNALFLTLASALMFLMMKWLNKIFKEYT
jgi:POT family proton-dependent oligopeptide transporter